MNRKYLPYVNILQGTDSTWRFSRGNTLPLTQLPFGMNAFAPQNTGIDPWWFSPHARTVEGIRLTHQPSPWIGDFGTMLLAPQADVALDHFYDPWTHFRRAESALEPNRLKISFGRSGCVMELVPTLRGAVIRADFDHDMPAWLSFFNMKGVGGYEIDAENSQLRGWTDGCNKEAGGAFKMYIVVRPRGDWADWKGSRANFAGEEGACAHLAVKKDCRHAEFMLGTSYISYDQALRNCLEEEDKSFETLAGEAERAWEAYLSTIEIDAPEDEMRTFYSCMYRTGLFPMLAHEMDENGNAVHFSPYTGKVHPGVRYIGQGFWDTFRTSMPLFSLTKPQLYRDIVASALSDYREGGWLPRWIAPGEVGCMPSTLIDSVLAQAATAGLLDRETLREVYDAMKHHADHVAPAKRFGRTGIAEFLEYGYVPCDLYHESVNLTLDFAYGDYCVARVAQALGHHGEAEKYLKRGRNYAWLFDKTTGFMRAKDTAGSFKEPFDPIAWDLDYTESAAWQATFSVYHDFAGLAELMGGREKILEKLDALFAEKPGFRVGTRGFEIHEETELAAADFGQCAISNQPSFHIPYLYTLFGQPEKTLYWVNRMCDEEFRATPDGFPGDEDNGSTAAWYILSRLGIYPVCPADNTWVKIPSRVMGTFHGTDIEEFREKLAEMKL